MSRVSDALDRIDTTLKRAAPRGPNDDAHPGRVAAEHAEAHKNTKPTRQKNHQEVLDEDAVIPGTPAPRDDARQGKGSKGDEAHAARVKAKNANAKAHAARPEPVREADVLARLDRHLAFRDWAKWDSDRKGGLSKSVRLAAAHAISRPGGHAHPDKPGETMSTEDVMNHAKGLEHAAGMIDKGSSPEDVEKAAGKAKHPAHARAMRGVAAAMRG